MSDQISPALIKRLRERTDAGIMDCKKALSDTKGDFEAAIDILKKRGIAGANKKSERMAKEGAIAVYMSENGKEASIVELNSETDFVSRNDKFQNLIKKLVKAVHDFPGDLSENLESFKDIIVGDMSVRDLISEHVAIIGENINLRRAHKVRVNQNGVVAAYIHNALGDGIGKVGVLVVIESEGDKKKLLEFGKQIAMHIAAFRPEALSTDQLSESIIRKECAIFREQAAESGKPSEIIEKMIDGRLQKLYKEIVLLEQPFVMDNKQSVKEVMMNLSRELETPVNLISFIRFGLGEGIGQ